MFAVVNLDRASLHSGVVRVMSFAAGPEQFAELVEWEGIVPARIWLASTGSPWRTGMRCRVRS